MNNYKKYKKINKLHLVVQVVNKQDQNKIQIFTICSILDFFFNKNFNIIIFFCN